MNENDKSLVTSLMVLLVLSICLGLYSIHWFSGELEAEKAKTVACEKIVNDAIQIVDDVIQIVDDRN